MFENRLNHEILTFFVKKNNINILNEKSQNFIIQSIFKHFYIIIHFYTAEGGNNLFSKRRIKLLWKNLFGVNQKEKYSL